MIWNILCPHCGAILDATDGMLGGKVECGGCAHIFTAPNDAVPAPDPRYDRGPREYEDEPDDFDNDTTPGSRPGNGRAIASLVLGILALTIGTLLIPFTCAIAQTVMGVLAVLFGFYGLKTEGRKLAIAGMVMGALAAIFSLLAAIMIGSFFASLGNAKPKAPPPPPTVFKTVPNKNGGNWNKPNNQWED